MVLGLSRLRSGETSGEMQVSCGWTRKTAAKSNFPVHFCFLCVCVFMYVYVCMCVLVIEYVVCVNLFYCCLLFSFNVLLFLYLQFIYSMCKCSFQIQDVKIKNFQKKHKVTNERKNE